MNIQQSFFVMSMVLVFTMILGFAGPAVAQVPTFDKAQDFQYASIQCAYRDYVRGVRDDIHWNPVPVIVQLVPPGLDTYYQVDVRSHCPKTYLGFPETGALMSPYRP